MGRVHAFELEDQAGFPVVLRDAGTAYLRFAAERTGQAESIRPLVERVLKRSGEKQILDLCSGGGGPAIAIVEALAAQGQDVELTLTDRFPNRGARERVESLSRASGLRMHYEADPVDATEVDPQRLGLRTFFNAFHHFRPLDAEQILRSAVDTHRSILVVEVLQRRLLLFVGMLAAPLVVLLVLPFLRPFRLAWLPLTYLIPVIPFFIMWDGMVSCLRIYSEDELQELVGRADPEQVFDWTVEEIPMAPAPIPGIALSGIPRERARDAESGS